MAKRVDYGPEVTRGVTVEAEIVPIEPPKGSRSKEAIQRGFTKSLDVVEMLKAVVTAHTPQEQQRLLRRAAELAEAQNSWYGILEVLRFELEYGVGKPVQRQVSATIPAEMMAEMYADDE